MQMKLAIFAIVMCILTGAEALVDPYSVKNMTEMSNETYEVFENLMDFAALEKSVEHPQIPDSLRIQKKMEQSNETQTNTQTQTKKKNVYRLNFLGVIFSLIFMPFILMITLFGYLVALCVFCIHEFTILFFVAVFVFLMILFWIME
jgi:hypothetical protein